MSDTLNQTDLNEAQPGATTAADMVSVEKLVGALEKIIKKDSIAIQVSDEQRMSGPNGKLVGVTRDVATDKLIVNSVLIEALTTTITTEFTLETMQDMMNLYGEDIYDVLAHYLSDELAYKIDEKFFTLVNDIAKVSDALTFDGATYNDNIYDVVTQIFAKINVERMKLAEGAKRPLKNYAIVTSHVASLLMNNSILAQDVAKGDTGVSLLGSFAGLDIYLDNTHVFAAELANEAQQNTVELGALVDGQTYSITINGTEYSLTYIVATHTNVIGYATALASTVNGNPAVSAGSAGTTTITIQAVSAGTPYTIAVNNATLMTLLETVANVTAAPEVGDYVIIGTKGNGFSKASTIWCPYIKEFTLSDSESTGNLLYHLKSRSVLAQNPTDTAGTGNSKYLVKFNVDLNDLALFTY